MGNTRSQGWSIAKREGHLNEEYLSKDNIPDAIFDILEEGENIISVEGGGKNQKPTLTIFGDKAPSKTDKIVITNKRKINLTLKKSKGGQVYLISSYRFFSGFQIIYNQVVPDEVVEIITLFTGESPYVNDLLKNEKIKTINQKLVISQRNRRLCIDSLKQYDNHKVIKTKEWFQENNSLITDFVFRRGLSAYDSEFAEYLYYKDFVNNTNKIDLMVNLSEIIEKIKNNKTELQFGKKYGGTSMNLPFGHLQMHKGVLQFHHNYKKIQQLLN